MNGPSREARDNEGLRRFPRARRCPGKAVCHKRWGRPPNAERLLHAPLASVTISKGEFYLASKPMRLDRKNTKVAYVFVILLSACSLVADDVNPALKPPRGAQEALVVFEDLQCPQCRNVAPLLRDAGKAYKIPVVRHDFPLPMHNWSFEAAVIAHYFDAQSKQLGYDFRDYIFEHQPEITPRNLRSFAERFAADRKITLPFVVDPQGKLAAEVNAERNLGNSVGINHTPTIYVVSAKPGGKPFIEVTDRNQLFQTIDAMRP